MRIHTGHHGPAEVENCRLTKEVIYELLNVDESISLPVLKVHAATKVSMSIKNLWGCHPDTPRLLNHKNLAEKLTLIA